jgi:uncharacterized protein YqhQ
MEKMLKQSPVPRLSGKLFLLISLKVAILIAVWIAVGRLFPPDSFARQVVQLLIACTLVAMLAWLILQLVIGIKNRN